VKPAENPQVSSVMGQRVDSGDMPKPAGFPRRWQPLVDNSLL
jgi:hypothetical protein